MNPATRWPIALGVVGALALTAIFHIHRDVVSAQARKRMYVTRLYTGPDNQTHIDRIEASFAPLAAGTSVDVSRLMTISGAELVRIPAGTVLDWHPAPQRQYVVTLSGRGEIEVAGGQKISREPGDILLAEDTTGKGHITRTIGQEDSVSLWLPLADQAEK